MPTDVTERVVTVEGTPVSVLEGGKGPALLLLHAAGGAGAWLRQHELLARRFRVIAPDHPGFGRTALADAVQGVDDIAFLYLDLMDELGLEDPIVVGASFGGWIAAEMAVLAGEGISRLVLVGAIGLRIPSAPFADTFAMGPQQKLATLFHDPAAAAGLLPAQPDVEAILALHRDEAAFARYAWTPFCCNPKLMRRLHRITAPTLVLWGEHDRLAPRAHGERYAELIAGARMEIVPGAGHAVLLERPGEAVETITRFLAS